MSTVEAVPSSALRKIAAPVKHISHLTAALIENMFDTMKNTEAIGLAAPQLNVNKSILVWSFEGDQGHIINPIIQAFSEETSIDMEGCLSIPQLRLPITRSVAVQVRGVDVFGEEVIIINDTFVSRILQHEIDHLNGILMIDRAKIEAVPEELRPFRIDIPE